MHLHAWPRRWAVGEQLTAVVWSLAFVFYYKWLLQLTLQNHRTWCPYVALDAGRGDSRITAAGPGSAANSKGEAAGRRDLLTCSARQVPSLLWLPHHKKPCQHGISRNLYINRNGCLVWGGGLQGLCKFLFILRAGKRADTMSYPPILSLVSVWYPKLLGWESE